MHRLAQTIVGPEIDAPLLRKFRKVLIAGLKICEVIADFRIWVQRTLARDDAKGRLAALPANRVVD